MKAVCTGFNRMYRAQKSSVYDCFANQNVTTKNSDSSTEVRNQKKVENRSKKPLTMHLQVITLCA